MARIPIGVIGCGYWGPNLIRNLSGCPLTEVAAVYDANPDRLAAIGRAFGYVKTVDSVEQFLELPLRAAAIATPVGTHFSLAKNCLEAGLHVLVEKPLATTAADAEELVALAARQSRILMVDHTYLFNNAIRKIKELVDADELGELYYVDSVRINLGLFQRDVNVVWDLAPHDLSIVEHVLGAGPAAVSATGCATSGRRSRTSPTSTWTTATGCWPTSMSTGCRRSRSGR